MRTGAMGAVSGNTITLDEAPDLPPAARVEARAGRRKNCPS